MALGCLWLLLLALFFWWLGESVSRIEHKVDDVPQTLRGDKKQMKLLCRARELQQQGQTGTGLWHYNLQETTIAILGRSVAAHPGQALQRLALDAPRTAPARSAAGKGVVPAHTLVQAIRRQKRPAEHQRQVRPSTGPQ